MSPDDPTTDTQLAELRRRLEETDAEIHRLRTQRSDLAFQAGRLRSALEEAAPRGPATPPAGARPGHLGAEQESIFQEVHSARTSLEQPSKVAFLGPPGTFTHLAVEREFGAKVRAIPCGTMTAVFRAVEQGRADVGVVPVESATEGGVDSTLDNFLDSSLQIVAELALPVSVALLAYPGLDLAGIARIYAHPKTLARCRRWLDETLPSAVRVEVPSSAEGARMTMDDPQGASVASETAVRIFGLDVLAREIQDPDCYPIRFLVLGHGVAAASGRDRTTLLLTVKDGPGALLALLEPLARRAVNLTRIENGRILHHAGEQAIYLDLEGHASDVALVSAMAELRGHCLALKVLGSYPRAGELQEAP